MVKLVGLGHVDGLREAIKCLEGRHGIAHVMCIWHVHPHGGLEADGW